MKRILSLVVLSAFLYNSCDIIVNKGKTITDNGVRASKVYAVKDFRDIEVSSSVKVTLIQANDFEVKLEGSENILPTFEVRRVGEKLVIKPKENYNLHFKAPVRASISAPEFRKLEASGACSFEAGTPLKYDNNIKLDLSGSCDADLELYARSVSADISGACRIRLRGAAQTLEIEGSGASKAWCFDFSADAINIDFSGAGMAEVNARSQLKANISGAANIRYKGNPHIAQEVSGAASIAKAD